MKNEQPNPALTFITAVDITRVLTHIKSHSGAYARLTRIKKALGKKKHQGLTVEEFADWEALKLQAVMDVLYSC